MSEIVLYPGNWLYNAGVVGLLVSIERVEKLSNYYGFNNDGSVSLGRDIFNKLDVEQRYFSEERISSIVGSPPCIEIFCNHLGKINFIILWKVFLK